MNRSECRFSSAAIWFLGWGLVFAVYCSASQELSEQTIKNRDLYFHNEPCADDSGTCRLVEYKDWIYYQAAPGEPYSKRVPGICPQWRPKAYDGEIRKFYLFLPVGYDGKSELWIADVEGCLWGKAAEGYFQINTTPVLSSDGRVLASVFRPLTEVQKGHYYLTAIEINDSISTPSVQQWLYHSEGAAISDLEFIDRDTLSFSLNKHDEAQDRMIKETKEVKVYRNVAESFKEQKEYFLKHERVQVTGWDYARQILLGHGTYTGYSGGKQYHSGWVAIQMNNGMLFLTKPLQLDDIFSFMTEYNLNSEGFASE